jgi:hypothetical protein
MERFTYFLRCAETDKALLYALAVKLGVLTKTEEGYSEVDCAWDEVGYIYEPTGEVVDDTPVMAVKANKDGVAYWHVNLVVTKSLGDLAEAVYAKTQDKTLGAALADMGRFFIVGEDGRPVQPHAPARVFL